MGQRSYWVYILASRIGGTLYIGVTSDLIRRVYEHREQEAPGFTKRYGVTRRVYFEQYDDPESAIRREKRLEMGTGLEDQVNRTGQSQLGRPLSQGR